jgi:hypothetical protein
MRNLANSQAIRPVLASTEDRKPGQRSTPRSQSKAVRQADGIDPERFYGFDDFCDALQLSEALRRLLLASLGEGKPSYKFIELPQGCRVIMGGEGLRHLVMISEKVRGAQGAV